MHIASEYEELSELTLINFTVQPLQVRGCLKLYCGEYVNLSGQEYERTGEKCVMRSIMICTTPFTRAEKSRDMIRLVVTRERRDVHNFRRT